MASGRMAKAMFGQMTSRFTNYDLILNVFRSSLLIFSKYDLTIFCVLFSTDYVRRLTMFDVVFYFSCVYEL